MRKKKLALNTTTALALQISSLICGFILPRLILRSYGSETNGLVTSIAQFLSAISFLDAGMGAVVASSLYKPLADHDNDQMSRIMVSASRFYKTLAAIFIVYVAGLCIIYPQVVESGFSFGYSSSLILIMCIDQFARFYFGIVYGTLLQADQREYIQNIAQIVTVLTNTAATAVIIKFGASIQAVKLVTSLIFLLRPLILRIYVRRHYCINWKIAYDKEPIEQKWNGIAQHISNTVLVGTDTIVLSLFSSLSNVSIYSVYFLVINGVKMIFSSITDSFMPLFGDLWAKHEQKKLGEVFSIFTWVIHNAVVVVFGCTSVLIVPFVRVYTAGIVDIDYIVPLFGLLLSVAYGFYMIKMPYNLMIKAAGHYKQTQGNYIITMCINIVLSVATVIQYGLVGVAIGTLVAMVFQALWTAYYNSKVLIEQSFGDVIKMLIMDITEFITAYVLTYRMALPSISYLSWVILAVKVTLIWLAVVFAFNIAFGLKRIRFAISYIKLWRIH